MSDYKVEFRDEETGEKHSMILDDDSLSLCMPSLLKMARQITNIYDLDEEESKRRRQNQRKARKDWEATQSVLFGWNRG